jgi:saccharopine dehydrogenase-like NADP-dependent oxidoreductase
VRVAVLGAGGTIAPAIVRDLAESDEVTAMRLLDLDLDRAEEVAGEHGGGKAVARRADATANLGEQLRGMEVLVNSAHYPVNLAAMEACLEAGCHYMDLGGLYHTTAKQLELAPRFEQHGLLALLGVGSAPGKTNLMATRAVRELGGQVDAISVAAAGRDLDPPGGMAFPYAVRTLIAEITQPPMALINGHPRELDPMSTGPVVDFGDEIGEAETIFTLHSEVLTFGSSFGAKYVTFALSLSLEVLKLLGELAEASEERVAEAARSASPPSPNTISAHVVEATRGEQMLRVSSVTPRHEGWGVGGGILSTGSVAAASVRLLARGKITKVGALPPELCIDSDEMFGELETRGVRFHVGQVQETRPDLLETRIGR